MILTGTLDSAEHGATVWQSNAAMAAHAAATRPEQTINATRHEGVRRSVACLFDQQLTRDARRAHVVALLTDSLEKQARFAGVGRIHLERRVVA